MMMVKGDDDVDRGDTELTRDWHITVVPSDKINDDSKLCYMQGEVQNLLSQPVQAVAVKPLYASSLHVA